MISRYFIIAVAAVAAILSAEAAGKEVGAIYQGIEGYGTSGKGADKDSFRFRFNIEGASLTTPLPTDSGRYSIQNMLQEGERYLLNLSADGSSVESLKPMQPIAEGAVESITPDSITIGGSVYELAPDAQFYTIDPRAGGARVARQSKVAPGADVRLYGDPVKYIDRVPIPSSYTAPISATPGLRTIKNLLATALSAAGTTLYVYGGAWDWQDRGAGPQARTVGVPQEWIRFFQSKDESYNYKERDPRRSYYPWHGYNEYYFAGADCSGLVGWSIYNVMNTESGHEGYVSSSRTMAADLADRGLGSLSKDPSTLRPGDIVGYTGHIWIYLGKAADGSHVIVHSTVNHGEGSGPQLSALNNTKDCDALYLSRKYMSLYPQWSSRYAPAYKDLDTYLRFTDPRNGIFHWNISDTGLTDPDGYLQMSAEEILTDLFGISPDKIE